MYVPGSTQPVPTMVSTMGWWSLSLSPISLSAPSSNANPTANLGYYYPLIIPATCVVRRLWWANGATVSASYNVDAGVYADAGYKPGAKLISTGSTAQGTASQVQFVDVTDTPLAPGRYWLAFAASSTSATFMANLLSLAVDAMSYFQQSSALPLPATATPVEGSGSGFGYVFLCGFATTASP